MYILYLFVFCYLFGNLEYFTEKITYNPKVNLIFLCKKNIILLRTKLLFIYRCNNIIKKDRFFLFSYVPFFLLFTKEEIL